jgi:hypothetical protein
MPLVRSLRQCTPTITFGEFNACIRSLPLDGLDPGGAQDRALDRGSFATWIL